ncbi:MAG: type II secretion system protein GspG [Burkholderiales bacterium]|nr:type II secretion system protein GspG [Opitutaceae bacterium]
MALIAVVVIPVCNRRAPAPPTPESAPPPPESPSIPAPASPADRAALRPVEPSASFPRSPLADALNAPATTPADDLRAIGRMLALYRERFGAYPAFGDNAQLVNALAGANPHRIALLPRDVPAVSAATGELLDRWGAPYIFHSISHDALEIRSTGPDREPYTADDLVAPLGFPGAPRELVT